MVTFKVLASVLACLQIGFGLTDVPIRIRNVGDVAFEQSQIQYRLPNNTKADAYNISLATDIARGIFNFSGSVTINVTVLKPSNFLTLHARQLTIKSVSLISSDGVEYKLAKPKYDQQTEHLTIQSLNGNLTNKVTLHVTYNGTLRTDEAGFYRSSYLNNQNGKKVWLATTQFESIDARHAFPCYDEPALKATFAIRITHNPKFTAISNMPQIDQFPAGKNLVTTVFDKTPLTSPYLIAFVISDFLHKQNAEGSAFPHRVFAKPGVVGSAEFATVEGEKVLKALEKYLDTPFSLPKMDQIAIPDFRAGAMENWGLVTYREEALLYNESVHSFKRKVNVVRIISHEFGHQWFGNLVSPEWWSYLWLNEGFATLLENIGTDLVHPEWNYLQFFTPAKLQSTFQADATNSTRPMTYYTDSPTGIQNLFDNIAYSKSGCVLRMFLHALSEKTFRKGLKYYLKENAYKSAADLNLFKSLEQAAKEDKKLPKDLHIAKLFGSWSNQKGFPLLTVNRNYDDNTVTLKQERYFKKYPNNEANLTTWWIPFNFDTANKKSLDTTPVDWLPQGAHSKVIELKHNCSSDCWVIFNKQQTGYYRVLYDKKNYELLMTELNLGNASKLHPSTRSQILDDLNDFVLTGRLPSKILFKALPLLKHETNIAPWLTAQSILLRLRGMLNEDSEAHERFRKFAIDLVEPFYQQHAIDMNENDSFVENSKQEVATSLACTFGSMDCLDDSYKLLKESLETGSFGNKRELIIKYGIRNADSVLVRQIFDQFMATSIPEQKQEYLTAIGYVNDKNILNKYLKLSLDPSASLTKDERTDLCISVASGNQYGMKQAIHMLFNRFEEATERLDMNKTVVSMSYVITTSEAYYEFLPLVKKAVVPGLRIENALQKSQSDLEVLEKRRELIKTSILKYINADGTVNAAANDA